MPKIHRLLMLLVVLLTFMAGLAASQAGRLLVIAQTPVRSDVILVFAGDAGERMERAIALYEQDYADKIVVSGGPVYMQITEAHLMYDHALSRGIPPEDVIMEEEAQNTFQNALYCRKIMEEHHFKSALVVSSEYHMLRVRSVCEQAFKGSSMELVYCAAEDPNYDPERWWANNKSLLWTVNEYIKILGYELGLAM